MLGDIGFDPAPIAIHLADFFAGQAKGEEAPERLQIGNGILQLPDEILALALNALMLHYQECHDPEYEDAARPIENRVFGGDVERQVQIIDRQTDDDERRECGGEDNGRPLVR